MMTSTGKSKVFSTLSSILRHKPMRPIVRVGMNLHVLLYRLTGGKAQVAKYPTMLLTVRGRKSGRLRTTPVIYVRDGDCFVIAAAYSGSDQNPAWWLNLQNSMEAIIQVNNTTVRVRAALATPRERERLWTQLVAMYPYFTEYQERTTRQIPVILLQPTVTEKESEL
jgi:F420H(2)-dependent quinone reductase